MRARDLIAGIDVHPVLHDGVAVGDGRPASDGQIGSNNVFHLEVIAVRLIIDVQRSSVGCACYWIGGRHQLQRGGASTGGVGQ